MAFSIVSLVAGVANAQLEVLSSEQVSRGRQSLALSIESTKNNELKSYLQNIQKQSASNKSVMNAARVANDLKTLPEPLDAFFTHYSVPAMSPMMRLPDAFPSDGTIGGPLHLTLAQDQYETASFVTYPFKDKAQVDLKISQFRNEDGDLFPQDALDLKVVKVWYQNGNAWYSYFDDQGLVLVPELLLYDENLIRVDTIEQANYARVRTDKEVKEVWISAPRRLNVGFNAYQEGFTDAETLQPVAFKAGEFKQFVLKAHSAKGTKPGIYSGHIEVTAKGEKPYKIPVKVRILDYELPLPKANYNTKKDFLVTFYGAWPEIEVEHKAFMPILESMRQHNFLHPRVPVSFHHEMWERTPKEEMIKEVNALKEAGFETRPVFAGASSWVGKNLDGLMRMDRESKNYKEFFEEQLGHHDVFVGVGDERNAAFMVGERAKWRVMHQNGLKLGLAGRSKTYFNTSAFNLDNRPVASAPGDPDAATPWSTVDNKFGYTGFYASQHTGSENPAFVRRQHGLLGYLSNFDMINNYKFAFGPWNDRTYNLYRPMVLAYPTGNGLVETLQYEGFREGIDDIRYATKLRVLAEESIQSAELDRIEAGRKAQQWLTMLDGNSADLNTVRSEMIEKIEELIQLAK